MTLVSQQPRISWMSMLLSALSLFVVLSCTSAFVVPTTTSGRMIASQATHASRHSMGSRTRCSMSTEELEQVVDFVNGRKSAVVDEGAGIATYEFDIVVPGRATQSLHHRITRMVKEKANYPGHRRGTIPRHVLPEVNKFVIEEIVNENILLALNAHNLAGADGDGTNAELKPELDEMIANFKPGKELPFSCSINAKPKDDGEGEEGAQSGVERAAIDVEASTEPEA